MSNHLHPQPVGIEYRIQEMQVYLYQRLYQLWGGSSMTAQQFEMFGMTRRNYKTQSGADGFIPEAFMQGKEYKEVLYDDTIYSQLWFAVYDKETVKQTIHTYDVSLCGFVDLSRIKPDVAYRADTEVVNEVCTLLDGQFGFQVTAVYSHDVDKILEKYSGERIKKGYFKFNMQPHFCFRIDMQNVLDITLYNGCFPQKVNPVYYSYMSGTIRVYFKSVPNAAVMQVLVDGKEIEQEYYAPEPTLVPFAPQNTLTIPYLIGRYVLPRVYLDDGVVQSMPYNPATGTFDNSANGGFIAGSYMQIDYNVSN